jgi:hypothetical protein
LVREVGGEGNFYSLDKSQEPIVEGDQELQKRLDQKELT